MDAVAEIRRVAAAAGGHALLFRAPADGAPGVPRFDRQSAAIDTITQRLRAIAGHARINHFRHRGMIWAADVVTDLPDFNRRFYAQALQRGLLMRPLGNTIYLMPPYVLRTEDADWMADQALGALNDTLAATC